MNQNKGILSREEIVKVVLIILKNWYFIVGFPMLAFVFSYFYAHRIQEVYAAKSQILLKAQETYDYQQQINRGLGLNSSLHSYEYTASQMRVIKSTSLLEQVLEELDLNVSYYIVGRLKVSEVYQNIPFTVLFDERAGNVFGQTFSFNIIDTNTFRLKYEIGGVRKDKVFEFNELLLDDGLYFRVEKGKNLNRVSLDVLSSVNYQFQIHSTNSLLSKYQQSISVKNIDYTSIVEIALQDEISQRAVEVLEVLAEKYVASTIQSQLEVNENTIKYIDRQLNEITGIINEIEVEIESFKESEDILNIDRQEEGYFSRLTDVESEIRMLEINTKALDDLTSFLLKTKDIDQLLPPSLFVSNSDEEISKRVRELYDMRKEYASLLESGTPDNPRLKSVQSAIASLKNDLIRYIDAQKSAVQQKMNESRQLLVQLESTIKGIPQTQRELLNIERKLQVNEKLYDYLLSKRAETIIAKAGLLPETKVIERPRPAGVVYPDKLGIQRLSTLMGLALAVLVIVIKVLLFQKVTNILELKDLTSLSILGSIPKKRDLSPSYHITTTKERSDLMQAFRGLRTNLQFLKSDAECQKVLITSLSPGEGKTFTSINLASILALAEKNVLVIDFDLHKPRLHKALGLSNEVGVSNYLSGQAGIEQIILNTEVENLKAITCGPVPPNGSELILRAKIVDLWEYLEQRFDYIILDTPPITLITDALILMQAVDTKLFVLNTRNTKKSSVDYIERLVEENALKDVSLILNEEVATRLSYYYGRYGYGGYGYNYGYQYGE